MRSRWLWLYLVLPALLAGCLASGLPAAGAVAAGAGETGPTPQQPPLPERSIPERSINDLPWRELWQVVTFDGQSIGYSRLRLEPLEGGLFRAQSEVALRLSYLGGAKEMVVRCTDTVGADFSLRRLDQEALIDGSLIRVAGEVSGQTLLVDITQAGRVIHDRFPLAGKIYPASAINLVAWLRGLGVGDSHSFPVFEPQERRVLECRQKVAALEDCAGGLCEGKALRIETKYAGMRSTAWISLGGEPLLEQAMGVLVTRKADEVAARAALAEAAAGRDGFSDFVLVRIEPKIPCEQIERLILEVEGLPPDYRPLSDARQRAEIRPSEDGRRLVVFSVGGRDKLRPEPAQGLSAYLAASPYVESGDEEIVRTAAQVVGEASGEEAVRRVVSWVNTRLSASVKDRVSALDALRSGEGDCQAHAYLCAALLRAAGIPCRIVSGLCYAAPEGGFLYHTWCEAYSGGWLAVDPIMGGPADAGHIKLVEGEDIESWAPLAEMIGRLRARVVEFRCAGAAQARQAPPPGSTALGPRLP